MSYKDEREKAEKKNRKVFCVVFALLMFLVSGLCIFSAFYPASTWKYYVRLPETTRRREGELRIHFLDVGQGDCTLLEFPDGRTLLIDGGDGAEEHTSFILRYLNALKIKRPDFLLLTHSDSDHCGGLAEVLRVKGAGRVYAPGIHDKNINPSYAKFCAALTKSGAEAVVSRRYLEIRPETDAYPYSLVFLSPYRASLAGGPYDKVNGGDYDDTDVNDTSAVVWLDYGGVSALFCGDATSRVEGTLMRDYKQEFFADWDVKLDSTEILKVSHHGSNSGSGLEFLRFLGVETGVISCGRNNLYGHPDAEVCGNLASVGAAVYRTDRQGTVVVTIAAQGNYSIASEFTAA